MKRRNYSLIKRNGIYYYYTYFNGRRVKYSTGCLTLSGAKEIIENRIIEGTLECGGQRTELFDSSFRYYARDFWTNNCPYCFERKMYGFEILETTIKDRRSVLVNRIFPILGDKNIKFITSSDIKNLQFALYRQNYSTSSINKVKAILAPIFKMAIEDRIIKTNPLDNVPNFKNKQKNARRAFTLDEVKMLFNSPPETWGNPMAYYVCLVSAITGMRLGEVLALQEEDLELNNLSEYAYIHVNHSWNEANSVLKCPKNGKPRVVPMPKNILLEIINKFSQHDGFIFRTNKSTRPVDKKYINKWLQEKIKELGINPEGLCFHSFRHFANTQLVAAGLSNMLVQSVIGHTSDRMTENYYHSSKEALEKIGEAQGMYWKGII